MMLRAIVNQVRPHQLVHQLAVLVVLSGFFTGGIARTSLAAGLAGLGTLAMLLFSDYQHRHDDAAMGRRRLVHVLGERVVSGGIAASFAAMLGLAAWIGGVTCVLFVLGVFGGTTLYTLAKRRRRPLASYFGRFMAGVLLVGVYRAAFPEVELAAAWRLALAAGLLDLAGNLAGDLRDEVEDQRAGLRTMPLLLGRAWTQRAIVALLLGAHGVLAAAAPAELLLVSAFEGTVVVVVGLSMAPRMWQHAAVHGPKLVLVLVLGASLMQIPGGTLASACVLVGGLWLASYRAYLWSARAVMAESRSRRASRCTQPPGALGLLP